MLKSLDCFIYSTGNIDIKDLRKKIAFFSDAKVVTVSFLETDSYELSIQTNDQYDCNKELDFPDGFLYFKFIIEVGFIDNNEVNNAVFVTGKILEWLWKNNMPAVASCDYEDLLPENGGYKSKAIPWPTKKNK